MRQSAAQALGRLGQASPVVVAKILERLANEEEERVRFSLIIALGKLGQSQALTGLQEILLKVEDWKLRQEAAELLGEMGQADKDTLKAFYQSLLYQDVVYSDNVQQACAEALGQLASRFPEKAGDMVAYLINALDDPNFGEDKKTGRKPDKDGIYWALVEVVSKMPVKRG